MDGQREPGTGAIMPNGVAPVRDQATEIQRTVSEELFEAWRSHLGRIEREMQDGWQEQIRSIVSTRLADLSSKLSQENSRHLERADEARRNEMDEARRQATELLNQDVYRFQNVTQRGPWLKALTTAAERYARRVVVLMLADTETALATAKLDLEYDSGKALPSEPVPLCYAPALLSAMQGGRPVVAVRSGAEISVALENMLGPGADRAQVYPLRAHGESFGVLYVEGVEDGNALEVITGVAGWAAAVSREILKQTTFERPVATAATPRPATWNDLAGEEQELHLRAHRFARTQAAQMRLYRAQEVREGRAAANLYGVLQEPIDQARQAYHDQFVVGCESMVDYLHTELVKTLANNDERLLGGGYPGPLQ